MEITEVRIKLMNGAQDRLLGFCSITIDHAFVVRDLKIIKGSKGAFVAMPSRKLTDRCPGCCNKNPLRSAYCSQCGRQLGENRSIKSIDGRAKLYADIAHPINCDCRDMIQHRVLLAYDEELILAQQPGYICRYDDFGEFDLDVAESDRWDDPLIAHGENGHRRWDAPQPLQGPHAPCTESAFQEFQQQGRPGEFGDGLF
ncbi:SpoVG family protein [Planctomicrobium piriforme]|uniref:Stage V sporulation protein G n=1 Tax=Planctomicrobium piriforme TaxID=1576369 RepID=A0A1I3EMD3_9PLAN|nr:SpoVG family protein [Planctomicrobium piriforme]SFH99881.1 stage V sporulation protein G [Planctomicrobium piriforme]